MVIGHKHCTDGDWNALCRKVSAIPRTSWLYKSPVCASYFAMKSVFTLILDQPTNTNRDSSCLWISRMIYEIFGYVGSKRESRDVTLP